MIKTATPKPCELAPLGSYWQMPCGVYEVIGHCADQVTVIRLGYAYAYDWHIDHLTGRATRIDPPAYRIGQRVALRGYIDAHGRRQARVAGLTVQAIRYQSTGHAPGWRIVATADDCRSVCDAPQSVFEAE